MKVERIGRIETCYDEKFGVPRQPGLVKQAWGRVIFDELYRGENFIRGIDGFSHLWLIFQFHLAQPKVGKGTVRPPRLGGNERKGVFATRSPYRPNSLGLSVVELVGVDFNHPEGPVLEIRGADIVDGTPIVDVKPYVPFCDARGDAKGGFVTGEPVKMNVYWDGSSRPNCQTKSLIEETIALDPRPAYQDDPTREYVCRIDSYDVRWRVVGDAAYIFACEHSDGN